MNNLTIKKSREKVSNVKVNPKLYENKIDINEPVTEEQVKENRELIIDKFIKYCNAKDITNAYNLLSDDCKNEVFKNIETFNNNYIKVNFEEQRLYSKEKYNGSTYKVQLYNNGLSTGKQEESFAEDYYTIIEQDNEEKLNISSFVKSEKIERITNINNIKVNVSKKLVYMEYEIYEFNITNLTQNPLLLDTKQKTNTMYLLDKNGVKYYATGHEVANTLLKILPNATNKIRIKYIKELKTNTANKAVFEDIVLNYLENSNNDKKTKIEVNI